MDSIMTFGKLSRRFKPFYCLLLCFQLGLLPLAASAQQAVKLTFTSPYAPIFSWLKEMQDSFYPTVNKELEAQGGKYKIEWNIAMSGTLAKIPATLDAMSNGIADIGHLHPVFEEVRLGSANVGFYAPFSGADHRFATEFSHRLHLDNPIVKAKWDSQNLVYINSVSLDEYAFFSTKPIKSLADIKGIKVGASGPQLRWIEGTGSAPVTTSGAAAYNDLKSGVIDAVILPIILAVNAKVHTVAPNVLRAQIGSVSTVYLTANKQKWITLPREVQAAIQAGGTAWQANYLKTIDSQFADALAIITKDGGNIHEMSAAERQKWAQSLQPLGLEWARAADKNGHPGQQILTAYMDALRKKNGQLPRDWDKR